MFEVFKKITLKKLVFGPNEELVGNANVDELVVTPKLMAICL